MADLVGQQLGHYQLERLIGLGGFAEVYLGKHIHLNTSAAIKVLSTRLTNDDIEHFVNEARVVASLEHPNIMKILDFGIEEHIPFFVMSYARNGSIRQKYARGMRVLPEDIVSYVNQVADALQYAHDSRFIHRDIKPENILLGTKNEVLLSDFGIALIAHSSRSMNTQGTFGTITYMAPEQILGKPRPASDQYGLGTVVYEWLCGERPFHGTLSELAAQHLYMEPPSLQEKDPPIAASIDAVVLKALRKDPHARYQRIKDFAIALEQALQSEPGTVAPLEEEQSSSVSDSTPAIPSLASVKTPVSLWTEGVESADLYPSVVPADLPAPADQLTLLIDPAHKKSVPMDQYVEQLNTLPQVLPQPKVLPEPLVKQRYSKRKWLPPFFLLPKVSASAPMQLTTALAVPQVGKVIAVCRGHTDWVRSLAWSPDGRYVASASNDKTVQIWETRNGSRTAIYRGHTQSVSMVAWSPTGKYLASSGADNTAIVWISTTGHKLCSYQGHGGEMYAVAWSPDGKYLATAGADRTICIWDTIENKRVSHYRGHDDWVRSLAWSPNGRYVASASNDKTVQVWDALKGHHLFSYLGHSDWVRGVAWSPNGRYVASASNDKTVQVWDLTTKEQIFTYRGHSAGWLSGVLAATWSPTGKYIASAGEDQTVQIWSPFVPTENFTFRQHTGPVNTIGWSPNGKYLASASNDKTIQIWQSI